MPKKEPVIDENPYLALRAAKMARNQARLKELGLVSQATAVATRSLRRQLSTRTAPAKKTIPTRRSRRLSQESEPTLYKELHIQNYHSLLPKKAVTRKRPRSTDSTKGKVTVAPPPPSNSVRSINIHTTTLVLGEKGVLGIPMERSGKQLVIDETFALAAYPEDQQRLRGTRLSFNKYCGVQEWKNAIFLWVNLGGKDNSVINDFLCDGRQITWFGGSRMHDDSPVVHKLIKLGQEATESFSVIILWCRKYRPKIKTYSPYHCLGRLKYHSHIPESRPLSFVWSLLDYDALLEHTDPNVNEIFQSMIK
jgi:hypothetical protein